MSAASAAWPVYLIGPVQAGRPTGRRAALPIRLPLNSGIEIKLAEFLPVAAIGE